MTNPHGPRAVFLLAIIAALGCSRGTSDSLGSGQSAVAIQPAAVTLAPGESVSFSMIVSGPVTAILWSIMEGEEGGTVSKEGIYVAPSRPGRFHVVGVVIDQNHIAKSATAEVTVTGKTAPGAKDGGVADRPRDVPSEIPKDSGSKDGRLPDGGPKDSGTPDGGAKDSEPDGVSKDSGPPDGSLRDGGAQDGTNRNGPPDRRPNR